MAEGAVNVEDGERTRLSLVEVEEMEALRAPVVQKADALVIESQPQYEAAAAFLTDEIKPALKAIADGCDPVVQAAHRAHKAAVEQRSKLQAPLLEAEKRVKRKISDYLSEQERRRQELIRHQEAERRRQAEEERLRRASELEAQSETEAADEALVDESVEPDLPAPPPPATTPKAKGISARKVWKAEVVDLPALVGEIAAGKAPANLVKVDEAKLNAQVRALDGQVRYAGVRVYEEASVSARRG